jgi:glutathione S-transferase
MSEVIIYGVPGSPYVRKALLVCEEKGAPYRLSALAMGEAKTPAYLARHPFGRIPAIEHDGFALYEAQAIMRYVDLAFPGASLVPSDPKKAARMQQVMNIVDWYVMPSISAGIGWNRVVAPMFGMPVDEAAIAAAIAPARTCIAALEALVGDQPYVAGDQVSLGDLALIPHLDLFPQTPEGKEIMAGSSLNAWIERMRGRPSVQATDMARLMAAAA